MKNHIGKSFVLVVCLAVASTGARAGSAADKAVTGVWAAAPVAVDGSDADWQGVQLITDEKSGAEFAVRNDGGNLYLLFVFRSRKALTTLEQTGMRIYFNAAGQKKKDLGIHFRRRMLTAEELIADLEKKGEVLTEARRAEFRQKPAYQVFVADVINEKKLPAPADPAVLTVPPAFRAGGDRQKAVYEFRIPLSRVNEPGGIGAAPGAAVQLGFEWGGMSKEMRAAMMSRRAAMSTRAGSNDTSLEGALGGGSENADLGSGGPSGFERSPAKHAFWIDVTLASGR